MKTTKQFTETFAAPCGKETIEALKFLQAHYRNVSRAMAFRLAIEDYVKILKGQAVVEQSEEVSIG